MIELKLAWDGHGFATITVDDASGTQRLFASAADPDGFDALADREVREFKRQVDNLKLQARFVFENRPRPKLNLTVSSDAPDR
jgi:hypothetical protein